MKRRHQIEMESAVDEIIAGRQIKYILASVTPGGGKSALPIIAGRLIPAGFADRLCWVVPRKSLQHQGETNFIDPFFRNLLNHSLTIRCSTNDLNPCRGLDGCITTYQAVGIDDKKTLLSDFKRRRYVLVLDEFHHAADGSTWQAALQALVERAAFVVLMTGTLERGDGNAIAFIPYFAQGRIKKPVLESSDQLGLRVIRYTRIDALNEQAIIPLVFNFADAEVSWLNEMGDQIDYSSLTKVLQRDASAAIYTALTTKYADQLMSRALEHWAAYRRQNPRSKMLIVTAGIKNARAAVKFLKNQGLNAEIATSHDDQAAQQAILHFKAGKIDILVTIAMAYEGLDVPAATHLVCLTHIRSKPWIEQMLARVVRVDHLAGPWQTQRAYVWAPDDPIMRSIVDKIESEQVAHVKKSMNGRQIELFESEGDGSGDSNRLGIVPLASSIIGNREAHLGSIDRPAPSQPLLEKTPSELEGELREMIEKHVRTYAFMQRYRNYRINAEIKRAMGKPRDQMGLRELRQCLDYVRQAYPISQKNIVRINGVGSPLRTDRQRVSTKVKTWEAKDGGR